MRAEDTMAKMAKTKLKPNQKQILATLKFLGGVATTQDIARFTNLSANGVSQSLGALAARGLVRYLDGAKGQTQWMLEVPTTAAQN